MAASSRVRSLRFSLVAMFAEERGDLRLFVDEPFVRDADDSQRPAQRFEKERLQFSTAGDLHQELGGLTLQFDVDHIPSIDVGEFLGVCKRVHRDVKHGVAVLLMIADRVEQDLDAVHFLRRFFVMKFVDQRQHVDLGDGADLRILIGLVDELVGGFVDRTLQLRVVVRSEILIEESKDVVVVLLNVAVLVGIGEKRKLKASPFANLIAVRPCPW